MDAREYLEQIHSNKCEIRVLQIKKEHWLALAENTTARVGDVRVQSSGNKQSMASQVDEAVDIDADIIRLKKDIAERINILNKLNRKERNFLYKLYVQHFSLKEISYIYSKSYTWATTMHSRALKKFQELLDAEKV